MIERRATTLASLGAALCAMACSKSAPPPRSTNGGPASSTAPASTASVGTAPGATCPANGLWARCSVLYRLDRAGVAPRVDSTAKPSERALRAEGFVVKIGMIAALDVYLFRDSAARIAAESTLDKTEFVGPGAPQTIRRERTLIENANLLALLTSINDHQRERVADALTAGPPQTSTR